MFKKKSFESITLKVSIKGFTFLAITILNDVK